MRSPPATPRPTAPTSAPWKSPRPSRSSPSAAAPPAAYSPEPGAAAGLPLLPDRARPDPGGARAGDGTRDSLPRPPPALPRPLPGDPTRARRHARRPAAPPERAALRGRRGGGAGARGRARRRRQLRGDQQPGEPERAAPARARGAAASRRRAARLLLAKGPLREPGRDGGDPRPYRRRARRRGARRGGVTWRCPAARAARCSAGRSPPGRVGAVDQRDVGERLREVAELAASARIVLLGEQAHIVAQPEEPAE